MTSGGARKGAGRKPLKDKKQPVFIYIKTSKINKLGGLEKVKELLTRYVDLLDK